MEAQRARRVCPACGYRYDKNAARCVIDGSALVDLEDPLRGRLLGGRYRVGAELGAGSMATVYEALDERAGAVVALKVASEAARSSDALRARFEREGRVGQSVRHPSLVATLDVGRDGDTLFLVMERLVGETLAARVARGALPVGLALTFAAQLADALSALHEAGAVHRDVKPSNVFLVAGEAPSRCVRLLDLGVAHAEGDDGLTASRALLGTSRTMSPEQARGERATAASDLYSLGAVLFEMLTGAPVFRGNDLAMRRAHVSTPAPRVSSLRREVSDDVDELVDVLLAKGPSGRPHSAAHVRRRLEAIAGEPDDDGTRAVAPSRADPPETRGPWVDLHSLERSSAQIRELGARWEALAPTLEALARASQLDATMRRIALEISRFERAGDLAAQRREELSFALADDERRMLSDSLDRAGVDAMGLSARLDALYQLTEELSASLRALLRAR